MEPQARHLPADERRAVIIESVIALAGSQPPGTITTAAIASHMKLTQGALFRHFASKDAILQAVIEWVAERLLSRVDKAITDAASPVAALEAVFMAHVGFVSDHPGVPRLMFSELQGAPQSAPKRLVQALLRGYGERLHRLLEAGKAQGALDAALDTAAAANLFIGTIQGLVLQSLLLGDTGLVRQRAPGVFAIYLRGIRRSP